MSSVTADTVDGALAEIGEAAHLGADLVELRLDFLTDIDLLDPTPMLERMLGACETALLPALVTFRPMWEGGQYSGPDLPRLAVLKAAAGAGAQYIDVEHLAAGSFFSSEGEVPSSTAVIISHHNYSETPSDEALEALVEDMFDEGADIAKIATTAKCVEDSARMLALPGKAPGGWLVIALAMGEAGLPTRLLAPKFGGYLIFGALSAEESSATGQSTIAELRRLYRVHSQTEDTKVFGIVDSPAAAVRGPPWSAVLHNAALAAAGMDTIYVPLCADDLRSCLDAFPCFSGFCLTAPHQVLAALECADEADRSAARIGAADTLQRQTDGRLQAYNTEWAAAVSALEAALGGAWCNAGSPQKGESALRGKCVVVVGAGGAGRALAFGVVEKGARVIVCDRQVTSSALQQQMAGILAISLGSGASAVKHADVAAGRVAGDVLINSMPACMEESLVSAAALSCYRVVLDATCTSLQTRLLREAQELGCATVSGLEISVTQAAQQFELLTGAPAPVALMRQATLERMHATNNA
ncbi:aldolase [Coccomyxa subellipsoidea C-169]|uniref:Aldolase n=1 Tax=Coccomyxa subellipsoidea (strain C-169) TaxID=574566 RepID=I0YRN1_COCSC|nr:aldolase [Coccomyxa subellipsoidea C-169]EIE21050.1 aldolase [Coccomyxa subellipsoidea C-169]|eukprot:XP_005645594.1 aldolase [Coccomyxa subellipsoidea C-169]